MFDGAAVSDVCKSKVLTSPIQDPHKKPNLEAGVGKGGQRQVDSWSSRPRKPIAMNEFRVQ